MTMSGPHPLIRLTSAHKTDGFFVATGYSKYPSTKLLPSRTLKRGGALFATGAFVNTRNSAFGNLRRIKWKQGSATTVSPSEPSR
jgi:hypothetical protein